MKSLFYLLSLLLSLKSFSQDTVLTIKSGRWSDKSVWNKIPTTKSHVVVNHTLSLDISATVSGATVGEKGVLQFERSRSITLQSFGNIIVHGRLIMAPASASLNHVIRFLGIDESKSIGGGMEILDSDVGLWVTNSITLAGAKKTAWTRLSQSVKVGDTVIRVLSASGWRVGDSIAISPMSDRFTPGYYSNFSVVKIKSIRSNIITLTAPVQYGHHSVTNPFTGQQDQAEVMNLTRNVTIEGTPTGRAHVIFLMAKKQDVRYAGFNYMGPRRGPPGKSVDVLGRYAIHAHHCMYGTAGSIFEGVVVQNCGSHAYVFHASNGITAKNCISFNTFEDAYWWDFPPDNTTLSVNDSHGITYDSCIAALIKCDPANRGYRLSGFALGSGTGNTIKNCVVVGNCGTIGASAISWSEKTNYTPNRWAFSNNLAHNIRNNGLFTWQNDSTDHVVDGFTGFNLGYAGIENGAYHNAYRYKNMTLFGNLYSVFMHATAYPNDSPAEYGYNSSFSNILSTDSVYITVHTLPGTPTLFLKCKIPGVIVSELPARVASPPAGLYDFVDCGLSKGSFMIVGMEECSVIRVQNGQSAFQVSSDGIKEIPVFYNNK